MNARVAAPALPPALEWINTDQPPSLEALRGRIVLVNFWTFDCVNCINQLPDLRSVENKYHDGLSVIGVHAPKYDYQRQANSVLKAVNRHHIRHPVASDPGYLLWQAYGIQSWPTLAVIDAQGQLAALLPGEGRRQEADALIGQLLDEAAAKDLRVYESGASTREPQMPLSFPTKLLATDNHLWIADTAHNRLLECDHEGRVQRQFGSGNPGYWDGRNQDSGFTDPQGMTIVKDALYVADTGNHAVRRIRLLNGDVETVAGTGVLGHELPSEHSEPTKVAMSAPADVAGLGDKVYIALSGQHQIWQLDVNKNRLSVFAGSGQLGVADGDGVAATFAQPSALSVIGQQLVVADAAGSAIRLVRLLDNRVSTLIGAGLYDFGDVAGKRRGASAASAGGVRRRTRTRVRRRQLQRQDQGPEPAQWRIARSICRIWFSEPAGVSLAAGALWIANTNAHEIVRAGLPPAK